MTGKHLNHPARKGVKIAQEDQTKSRQLPLEEVKRRQEQKRLRKQRQKGGKR